MAGGARPCAPMHRARITQPLTPPRVRCAQESTRAPTTVRARRTAARAGRPVSGHGLLGTNSTGATDRLCADGAAASPARAETAVPIWFSSLLTGAQPPRRRRRAATPRFFTPCMRPGIALPAAPRRGTSRLPAGRAATDRPAAPACVRARCRRAAELLPRAQGLGRGWPARRPRRLRAAPLPRGAPRRAPVQPCPSAGPSLCARHAPRRSPHALCASEPPRSLAAPQRSSWCSSPSGGSCASWACPRSARACTMGGGCLRCSWR